MTAFPKNAKYSFAQWTSSIPHFCAAFIRIEYSSTYLVDVLQLVNYLTDHWLRTLHFQLMEVELIFHSIPCGLLAVSGKVKVKKRFVTREFEAK